MMRSHRNPNWPNDPPDDHFDLEKRAERYRKALGVEDLDGLAEQLTTLQRALRKDRQLPRRRYDLDGPLPKCGLEIVPLDRTDRVAIRLSRRPRMAIQSWGLTGRYVSVTAPKPFSVARLRFALPKSRLDHLYPATIVAARWDSHVGRFRLIPASGYSESGEYLYAQVTRPGIFSAIGLPRDPRILLALRLLATLAPWARAAGYSAAPIAQPMIEALLQHKLIRSIASNAALLRIFGYRRTDFPAALDPASAIDFTDGPIDDVIDKLPELDLLEALDPSNRTIKPLPDLRMPDQWPMANRRWESLGPTEVIGRIKTLAIHPENGDILYAGAAGGGVWKTVNGGRDWFPTMRDERSLAIGGLGIAPSNPNILYAATGEWTGSDDRPETPSGMGAGVYRTSDGGGYWIACAPIDSTMCTSVAVHPDNSDCVFVGGNGGLHRSDDGGTTWRTVLAGASGGSRGTATSVAIVHDIPNRIFAGVHHRGVYLSEDGGETWSALTLKSNGLPTGEAANAPKIAIGRGKALGSKLVCVKIDNRAYTSIDGGKSFSQNNKSLEGASAAIPWCNVIGIDPRDDSVILAGGTNLHRSGDRGSTWTKVAGYGTTVAGGQHAIAFHPHRQGLVYLANDEAVWASTDGGNTWSVAGRGISAAQAYDLSVSAGPALRVAISLQDVSARVFDGAANWKSLDWGEGGSVLFLPGRSDEIYADAQWSNLMLFRLNSFGEWKLAREGPDTALHANRPLAGSGATAHGQLFLTISADRKALLRDPGHDAIDWPIVLNVRDAKLTSVAIAMKNPRFVYAGDTNGRFWYSENAGKNWQSVRLSSSAGVEIAHLSTCPTDERRVLICTRSRTALSIFRCDLYQGHAMVRELVTRHDRRNAVRPLGDHWSWVETLHLDGALIELGRCGMALSLDDGETWSRMATMPPNAIGTRIGFRELERILIIGTHGRGVHLRPI